MLGNIKLCCLTVRHLASCIMNITYYNLDKEEEKHLKLNMSLIWKHDTTKMFMYY